mmetsp:Transcript_35337/g.65900  ORF Transcript_35337/g.65900 Transcript_35337/m.65900 type:complete len:170 (-) Transcript_35337:658-1167(-)
MELSSGQLSRQNFVEERMESLPNPCVHANWKRLRNCGHPRMMACLPRTGRCPRGQKHPGGQLPVKVLPKTLLGTSWIPLLGLMLFQKWNRFLLEREMTSLWTVVLMSVSAWTGKEYHRQRNQTSNDQFDRFPPLLGKLLCLGSVIPLTAAVYKPVNHVPTLKSLPFPLY